MKTILAADLFCTDAMWNPVRGCVKVSPGCKHCYAETFAERFRGVPGHPYEQGFDLRLVPEKLAEPLSWKKPRRVFVNSMSDLFHADVPDSFIDRVFAVMALAPQHTFQVLTKRAERMRAYLAAGQFRDVKVADAAKAFNTGRAPVSVFDAGRVHRDEPWLINAWPLPNVWLGVSVENQHFADERIPLLLQTPAALRFISAEPLLGPVDLTNIPVAMWRRSSASAPREQVRVNALKARDYFVDDGVIEWPALDWVIAGGESGPKARPSHPEWFRSLRDQCQTARVPFFFKQWGEWAPYDRGGVDSRALANPGSLDTPMQRVGKKAAGRLLDGRTHDEFPEVNR